MGLTQVSVHWVPATLSPGVKWPGCESDHSPPSSAEVRNEELYVHSPCISSKSCAGTITIARLIELRIVRM
jgi:hypothetical protein